MDIVKPIPPKSPMPHNCLKLVLDGSEAMPNLIAIKEKKKIPSGLPRVSPSITPGVMVDPTTELKLSGKIIAVLANANSGIMIKFTGLNKICSNLAKFFNGIQKETITPEIVA